MQEIDERGRIAGAQRFAQGLPGQYETSEEGRLCTIRPYSHIQLINEPLQRYMHLDQECGAGKNVELVGTPAEAGYEATHMSRRRGTRL